MRQPAPATPHRAHKPPRIHRHTLVEMNAPVFTARRDAAHACLVDILRRDALDAGRSDRVCLYGRGLRLLDDAILGTQRSQIQKEGPLLQYFHLLRDTLAATLALVAHEIRLTHGTGALSRLAAHSPRTRPVTMANRFSSGELNTLDSIDDLLKFGVPLLLKDSENHRKAFSPDDLRRYELARREYREHYLSSNFVGDVPNLPSEPEAIPEG
ncbi:MAG: hypothetical protein WCH61_00390 [bacterium]